MAEMRKKLSDKQFATLSEGGKRLMEAQAAFKDAQEYNRAMSGLILDFHGLTSETPGLHVDEATKELVYGEPETPAETPKVSKKKKD